MKTQKPDDLIFALKARFEKNMHRHKGIAWAEVQARIESNPKAVMLLSGSVRSMAVPHFTPRHTMRRSDSRRAAKGSSMIGFLLWLLLLVLCWPLALLALLLYPLVWLLSLPFRLVGLTVEGVFALLRALILLPARVLGGRR